MLISRVEIACFFKENCPLILSRFKLFLSGFLLAAAKYNVILHEKQ